MSTVAVYVAAGALVGFSIGLTGVGGGSLMTPLLLALGVPAPIAIGTDLLYASITKAGSACVHWHRRHVRWPVVVALASGSLPGALLTLFCLHHIHLQDAILDPLMHHVLGAMLLLTGISLIGKRRLQAQASRQETRPGPAITRPSLLLSAGTGLLLGPLITLSSVGAGAIGVVVLMLLYPRLRTQELMGSDVVHAVLLSAIAGWGHAQAGHVDGHLLLALCAGSLPATLLGTHLSTRAPEQTLRYILGTTLLVVAGKFVFFY